jgi:hypothetical protein
MHTLSQEQKIKITNQYVDASRRSGKLCQDIDKNQQGIDDHRNLLQTNPKIEN